MKKKECCRYYHLVNQTDIENIHFQRKVEKERKDPGSEHILLLLSVPIFLGLLLYHFFHGLLKIDNLPAFYLFLGAFLDIPRSTS